jgi:glycosyltransferase involved in cell wall biosynthesis
MNEAASIYIVDTIGEHSGMRHYDNEFQAVLESGGWKVEVLSNFGDAGAPALFDNFYRGPLVPKLWKLARSFGRYINYWIKKSNQRSWWIYQSYGMREVDLLFLLPLLLRRDRLIVLIHDVYNMSYHEGSLFKALKRLAYAYGVKYAVVHSTRARADLANTGFSGQILEVPLFRSGLPAAVDFDTLPEDVRCLGRCPGICTFLFFGTIRRAKGLDIVISAINELRPELKSKLRLVVAGQDLENVLDSVECTMDPSLPMVVLGRYISENELNFLFQESDATILPYREIYQSAVLDVAIGQRVPFVASDLPYFRKIKDLYPSFGYIFGESAGDLSKFFENNISLLQQSSQRHFVDNDVAAYYSTEHTKTFLDEMRLLIDSDK